MDSVGGFAADSRNEAGTMELVKAIKRPASYARTWHRMDAGVGESSGVQADIPLTPTGA